MNKYVLSDLIGEGSFGKVYKAVEKASGDTVAIKIINKVSSYVSTIDS